LVNKEEIFYLNRQVCLTGWFVKSNRILYLREYKMVLRDGPTGCGIIKYTINILN
jgi:hypothetical protein